MSKKGCKFAASNNNEINNKIRKGQTMKYQVKITENGETKTLPALMTREDAEWEKKMQLRLQKLTSKNQIHVEIIEAE